MGTSGCTPGDGWLGLRMCRGRWLCQNHRLSHATHTAGCHQPHHADTSSTGVAAGHVQAPIPTRCSELRGPARREMRMHSLRMHGLSPSRGSCEASRPLRHFRRQWQECSGRGNNAGTLQRGPLRDEAGSSCPGTAPRSRSRQEADGDDTGGRFLRQDAAGFLHRCSRCRAKGAAGSRDTRTPLRPSPQHVEGPTGNRVPPKHSCPALPIAPLGFSPPPSPESPLGCCSPAATAT